MDEEYYKGNTELKVIEKDVVYQLPEKPKHDLFDEVQVIKKPRLVHVKDNAEVYLATNLATETDDVFVCSKCGQKFNVGK